MKYKRVRISKIKKKKKKYEQQQLIVQNKDKAKSFGFFNMGVALMSYLQ